MNQKVLKMKISRLSAIMIRYGKLAESQNNFSRAKNLLKRKMMGYQIEK